MSNEILNTISKAIEAYNLLPELEAMVKRLEETLLAKDAEIASLTEDRDLYKMECDSQVIQIHELKDRIVSLEADHIALTSTNHNLEIELAWASRTTEDLRAQLTTKSVQIELLEADKKALQFQLEDSRGLLSKLKDNLASAFALVAPPAPEVADPSTFQAASNNPMEPVQPNPEPVEPINEANPSPVGTDPVGDEVGVRAMTAISDPIKPTSWLDEYYASHGLTN